MYFFFNDTATTEIYTLSLHDALPISVPRHGTPHRKPELAVGVSGDRREQPLGPARRGRGAPHGRGVRVRDGATRDRKSTRLNSSHSQISYAVFCLKKKKAALTADIGY